MPQLCEQKCPEEARSFPTVSLPLYHWSELLRRLTSGPEISKRNGVTLLVEKIRPTAGGRWFQLVLRGRALLGRSGLRSEAAALEEEGRGRCMPAGQPAVFMANSQGKLLRSSQPPIGTSSCLVGPS